MVKRAAYRGKYPSRIMEVSSHGRGKVVVYTNSGERFEFSARDTGGIMPKPGEEISVYLKPKKNPAPKRKTSARTQKAAVGYVNRPSQITKKSPTKRLKIRRAKNLQSPRGVFPNPLSAKKHYVIQAWKGPRMLGFVTMGGRISTEFPEAWQFPTKKDAVYHAEKYAKKSSAYDFKVDSVETYHNPVAPGVKKISHPRIKPKNDENVYVRESANGTDWLTVAVFPSQKAAIEYAYALDRKHGGRKYIEVFTR